MNSVSATVIGVGQNVNVVQVNSDGSSYHVLFVDAAGKLKLTRGMIDNTSGISATLIGTSAKVN